ncbi:hypothetical protein GUJ93_ZPchr0013g33893 [Zizania palustris]|uniref:HTH myb-type domain-containing protein n=1 Tax=Zizania palustris TaxID=103762 RepID=A0A8J6C357_ZIZPA|nr:hypothetical protein GUJ93_ZPchr0013g33893 [Zizania palustris]
MGLDVGEIGMGLDLSLDLKLFAARSAGRMTAAREATGVDACITSLEEERRKIEMFRRELPLCARLLADVIELMKEDVGRRRKDGDDAAEAEDGDKTKWMSTAQLWVDSRGSDSSDSENERRSESTSPAPRLLGGAEEQPRAVGCVAPPPYFRRDDRAVPAVGIRAGMPSLPAAVHGSTSPAAAVAGGHHRHVVAASFAPTMPSPVPGLSLLTQSQQQQQQARKSRRCWSPELHRQFVAALQQLGGPQVATPKQIREVMKVDGLTNDEVKSHLQVSNSPNLCKHFREQNFSHLLIHSFLPSFQSYCHVNIQKYRLHNRRSTPGASPASQPIVLVGDPWAPQELSCSQSGSPQGPLQRSGSGVAVSAATAGDSCCEDDDMSEGNVQK